MSYGISIDQPSDLIEQINDNLSKAPKLFGTAYKRNMGRVRSRWIKALRVEPPSASNYYKLPWKNDKQRIAVIIKLRKEGNLPYQRKHTLRDAWDVEIDSFDNGGSITVSNDAPEAQYVIGEDRQPMFEKIPWLEPNDVNAEFQDEAAEVLVQTYFTVFDPFAGVPG